MREQSTTAMKSESGRVMTEVNGRYIPGSSWSDMGYGVFWFEQSDPHVSATEFVSWIEETFHFEPLSIEDNLRSEIPVGGVAYDFESFVEIVSALDPGSRFKATVELELYIRLHRLALLEVAADDVLAFAAPASLSLESISPVCVRLTTAEEDGWIEWSSHTESYFASWVPAWMNAEARALFQIYSSVASDVWKKGWKKEYRWQKQHHARILVDVWMRNCTNVIVRHHLETQLPKEGYVNDGSSYRVMYRGEEEVVGLWKDALWTRSARDAMFAADGWLVWRVLKQAFAKSGWRNEWLFEQSGRAYYHLEFELVPPVTDAASPDWKLLYYVKHNHFSTRKALVDWWQSPTREWAIGREKLVCPDMWILPELLRAGEVVDSIRKSLMDEAPFECTIAPNDVFAFVTEEIALLRERGFSVSLPKFDSNAAKEIRVRVQVKRVRGRTQPGAASTRRITPMGWFQAEQLVDFDWNVVIDGEEVSREQFERMVAERTPYLQLGGSWKLIPIEAILAQVEEFGVVGKNQSSTNLLQFSRTMLMNQSQEGEFEESPIALDISFHDDVVVMSESLRLLLSADEPVLEEAPAGFHGELRDYQKKGYSWLLHLRQIQCGGCLADDMGLGKTIQVLAYFLALKHANRSIGKHLLICPTSLLQNWNAEIKRFTPDLRVHIHHGAQRNQELGNGLTLLEDALKNSDVVLTTYATLVRDFEVLGNIEWDVVVADEAQNIKNQDTKQAQAVCGLSAYHRVALTGTPVENRLEELWSIFQFVNPGYLGSLAWFRRNFVDPISNQPSAQVARKLHSLLKPVLLRRQKTDPAIQMELPDKWEVRAHAALTAEQAAIYQGVVNRLFVGIEDAKSGMSRRGQILAALVRLKQVCDHPCLVAGGTSERSRSGKLKLLLDLLSDVVQQGESALIFTQFRDMGELICEAIEAEYGFRPQFLHGGLSASARGEMVSNFQAGVDPSPILVLSLKAGGVGLNLTRANHVFHYDRWWNPAVEDQATDRAFRIGQTKDVQVHKFICMGTLEERIDALISSKRQLSAAVIGESEGWITELDNSTLRALFELDAHVDFDEVSD